jgi:hypothetical protein
MNTSKYVMIFAATAVVSAYLHELGHAIAGWLQAIAVIPSPAKEYILRPCVYWNQETWIALGGVVGTVLTALLATAYYLRVRHPRAEAVLFGALVPTWIYSLRYLVTGRGHDGTEWQAAQAALRLAPAGHTIDAMLLCLSVAGLIAWASRLRLPFRYKLFRPLAAIIGGTTLLLALQVANNQVFDRFFPHTQIVDLPAGLDPR